MSRITYELGYKGSGEYDTDNTYNMPANNFFKALNKLGQLEDIEEELGIDLVTLFKALKNGIYTKENLDNYPYACLLRNDMVLVLFDDVYKHEYLLKDYGKTWALTKEELE